MENKIPAFLLNSNIQDKKHEAFPRRRKLSFLDRTIKRTASSIKAMYLQGESAGRNNFLCRLNPLVKVISFIYLIIIISMVSHIRAHLLISVLIFTLYLFSGTHILRVYKKIISLAFIFGFLVFAPAALNVITPGEIVWKIAAFDKPYQIWVYHIPQNVGFTLQGCKVAVLLFLRVLNSVSLALLMTYTTSFPRMMKAFRVFFIPHTLLMIISLAYKYIFILCKTIEETYFALKSRLIGNIRNRSIRGLVAGRIFFIYKRSRMNYEQTYYAMLSRGYTGKVMMLDENKAGIKDVIILMSVAAAGLLFILI
jgi:cobalt/nickel transport system permease protein